MIKTIKGIIADQLIYWAIKLYKGKLKISLSKWVVNNLPSV